MLGMCSWHSEQSVLMWFLQLLQSQAKHSSPDWALGGSAEDLVGTGEERRAGSLADLGMDLADTTVQQRALQRCLLGGFWFYVFIGVC